MLKEPINFEIELPHDVLEEQVRALLPNFIVMQEGQMQYPRFRRTDQIKLDITQAVKQESGNWKVNGYYYIKN